MKLIYIIISAIYAFTVGWFGSFWLILALTLMVSITFIYNKNKEIESFLFVSSIFMIVVYFGFLMNYAETILGNKY